MSIRGALAAKDSIQRPLGVSAGAAALPCYYLTFDGYDYGSFAGIVVNPPATIAVWAYYSGASFFPYIILADGGGSYLDWWLGQNYMSAGGGASGGPIPVNEWHHWAINLPIAPAQATFFLDGIDSTTAPGASGVFNINRFGAYNITPDYGWLGRLAVTAIAPSVQNIPALWAAGSLHKPLDPLVWSTLCLNLRSEGGAGGIAEDESAGGNDATFGGGANSPAWGGLMSVGGPAGWTD